MKTMSVSYSYVKFKNKIKLIKKKKDDLESWEEKKKCVDSKTWKKSQI